MEFETINQSANFDEIKNTLKFTPLEFETFKSKTRYCKKTRLKFTPLEFETARKRDKSKRHSMLKFTPLEFETYR